MKQPLPAPVETITVGRSVLPVESSPMPLRDGRIRASIISDGIHLGGAERWMCDLVESTNHDVIQWIGVGAVHGTFNDVFASQISDLVPVHTGPENVTRLAAESDVVVSWFIKDLTPYQARCGGPVVALCHSPQDCSFSRKFMSCGFPGATNLASVSEVSRRTFPPDLWDTVKVIRNAIDPARVAPKLTREEQRKKWGVSNEAKVVGFIGRFSPEKGYQRVWGGLKHLPEDWRAVLVGSGIRWEDSKELARVEVGDRAVFPGDTKDIGSALNAFDCIVVPSDFESFCYVIVEAWAAGVPVISTPVGVATDHTDLVHMIPHNSCGYEVANAIKSDEAHPDMVRDRVENAKATAAGPYSMDRFGSEWTHYLASLAVEWFTKARRKHAT